MAGDFEQIQGAFLEAGLAEISADAVEKFVAYLALLQRWNTRLNLSAIREPGQVIQRHFVESAFAALHLPATIRTLLDYGSGAGFPGIPIAICRPEIRVTLAEAQAKKASFLREAARVIGIGCEVFDGRVESLAPARLFDAVTMRAVEKMEKAIPLAAARAGKCLVLLSTETSAPAFEAQVSPWRWDAPMKLPGAREIVLLIGHRD